MKLLESLDYKEGIDYARQFSVGERYVLDFAFIHEKVAIEADGENHKKRSVKKKDAIRDKYLRSNDWVTIRLLDEELFGYKFSFYKNLIKEVVEERKKQYEEGKLYWIDFTQFDEKDFR